MTDIWYCGRSSAKKFGPFTSAQLKKLADTGKLLPTDTVWKEGVEQGVPAAKVKRLFDNLPPAPSPAESRTETGPAPGDAPAAQAPETAAAGGGSAAARAESEAPPKETAAPAAEGRKGRVLSIKGGVLSSQDGVIFRFRKRCDVCGYGDTAMTTMRIRSGIIRADFFCRKCRKSRPVEIHGVM